MAIGFAVLFLAGVGGLAALGALPAGVAAAYLAASGAAAVAYWKDKDAAARGAWRTPEKTLHALALIGGWPGALVAQSLFRHKSRKAPFRLAFWATVALNCAALGWLLAAAAASMQ
jgi:uncharacterized membrane protein YsdA (DUF1294 family)